MNFILHIPKSVCDEWENEIKRLTAENKKLKARPPQIFVLKTANIELKAENGRLKSKQCALHILNMELTLEQLKNKRLKQIIEDMV